MTALEEMERQRVVSLSPKTKGGTGRTDPHRTSRAGRDSIDHPPRGHDDVANAVAGVIVEGVAHGGLTFHLAGIYARQQIPIQIRLWFHPRLVTQFSQLEHPTIKR